MLTLFLVGCKFGSSTSSLLLFFIPFYPDIALETNIEYTKKKKTVMSGLGLKSEEFSKAFQQIKFNLFVQIFNFLVVSSIVFGISRFLISINALSKGEL